ncbi:MAG TPA: hypothetical protein VLE96_00805 [Chlamydiales bacterium]|nr:hypothetical protein [Chlamydiales bacterium]
MRIKISWFCLVVGICCLSSFALRALKRYRHTPPFNIEILARNGSPFTKDYEGLEINDQVFHYLGHGDQSIAFENQDKRMCLSFF